MESILKPQNSEKHSEIFLIITNSYNTHIDEKIVFNITASAGGGWHDNGPGICKTEESGRGLYHN